MDERRLFVFRRSRGTSTDGTRDVAACEDCALSAAKRERREPLSFISGKAKGNVERLLWSEASDREGKCAYNKDELSVVVS